MAPGVAVEGLGIGRWFAQLLTARLLLVELRPSRRRIERFFFGNGAMPTPVSASRVLPRSSLPVGSASRRRRLGRSAAWWSLATVCPTWATSRRRHLASIRASTYYNNRFSNGPVWVEALSEDLGFGPIQRSTAGGNDFAYGGAQTTGTGGFNGIFIRDVDEQVISFSVHARSIRGHCSSCMRARTTFLAGKRT